MKEKLKNSLESAIALVLVFLLIKLCSFYLTKDTSSEKKYNLRQLLEIYKK